MIDLRGIEDSLAVESFVDWFTDTRILAPLFAKVAFLSWGPLGLIVSFVVNKAVAFIFKQLKEFAGEKFIAIARQGLLGELDNRASALAVIAVEKGIDSPEFKAARQEHKNALSKFGRFGKPSATS